MNWLIAHMIGSLLSLLLLFITWKMVRIESAVEEIQEDMYANGMRNWRNPHLRISEPAERKHR
jgi:hypothetical protein